LTFLIIILEEIHNYFTGKINFSEAIDSSLIGKDLGSKRKNTRDLSDEKEPLKRMKMSMEIYDDDDDDLKDLKSTPLK